MYYHCHGLFVHPWNVILVLILYAKNNTGPRESIYPSSRRLVCYFLLCLYQRLGKNWVVMRQQICLFSVSDITFDHKLHNGQRSLLYKRDKMVSNVLDIDLNHLNVHDRSHDRVWSKYKNFHQTLTINIYNTFMFLSIFLFVSDFVTLHTKVHTEKNAMQLQSSTRVLCWLFTIEMSCGLKKNSENDSWYILMFLFLVVLSRIVLGKLTQYYASWHHCCYRPGLLIQNKFRHG